MVSYQFSNDVEFKMTEFLQFIGTIKRTICRKVRTETILKIYNTVTPYPANVDNMASSYQC